MSKKSEGQKRYEQYKDCRNPEAIKEYQEQYDYINGTGPKPHLQTWKEKEAEMQREHFEKTGKYYREEDLYFYKIYWVAERREDEIFRIMLQRQREGKELTLEEISEIGDEYEKLID